MQEPKVRVFLPVGVPDPAHPLAQFEARKNLLANPRARWAWDAGFSYGFEVKNPISALEAGFSASWLKFDGQIPPYTVHMENDWLTRYYHEEYRKGDSSFLFGSTFWDTLQSISHLNPLSEAIVLHGARLDWKTSVPLDISRYNWRWSHDRLIALQEWHIDLLRRIRDRTILNPAVELLSPTDYIGRGRREFPVNAPLVAATYLEPRTGMTVAELAYLHQQTGCRTLGDIEHYYAGRSYFGRSAGYEWMGDFWREGWASKPIYQETMERFGFAAENGLPPSMPTETDESLDTIKLFQTIVETGGPLGGYLHIGGARTDLDPDFTGKPTKEYRQALDVFSQTYPAIKDLVNGRVLAHTPLERTALEENSHWWWLLHAALSFGVRTFVLEVNGRNPADHSWWFPERAFENSFFVLLELLGELVPTIVG